MISRRFWGTLFLATAALPSFSSINTTEGFIGVQQDMIQQVQDARDELKDGEPLMAMAHANLVLMDRPLKIFVSFGDINTRRQGDCDRAINAAIDLWNKGLDGEKPFTRTAFETGSDIQLKFENDVVDGNTPVGGLVKWHRAITYVDGQPTDKTSADVQVRVKMPRGGYMSFEHMRHEASHELGHVLGLDDSPRSGDIMSGLDLRHPVGKISDFELDALKRLRQAAQAVKDEALIAYTQV